MSTATMRLRRAGAGGLAAAVVAGTLVASAGSAFAAPAGLALVGTATTVYQGQSNQAAASTTLEFANSWATNAVETFQIYRGVTANDCASAAGIAAAIGFSAAPTFTLSGPMNATNTAAGDTADTKPTFTVTLGSSTTACATAGVKDVATVTFGLPSTGTNTDLWKFAIDGIKYNVGSTAGLGAVNFTAAGALGAGTQVNANVANTKLAVSSVASAKPNVNVALGTVTMSEITAGAAIHSGAKATVTLTLTGGAKFTAGVTPTVTVPSGYTLTTPLTATTNVATWAFEVTAPATATKATISVAGLKAASATTGVSTIGAATTASTVLPLVTIGAPQAALSVVNQVYTGGSDRYATAALLYNEVENGTDAILASGANFPDALSANYLAGQLGTGILLTTPTVLPSVTRNAILTSGVSNVYIIGGTGAVSQSIEDQISALHVGNVLSGSFINVIRIAGADRYATNQAVNTFKLVTAKTAIVANGVGFADALSAGPAVAGLQDPLVLTTTATLSATAKSQLQDLGVQNVVIVGGTGVVSSAVEDAIKAMGINVARLAGTDRTQTAAAIATWLVDGATQTGTGAFTDAQGFGDTYIYIARGDDFADALAGGPVAGSNSDVILLTNSPTSLGVGIPSFVAGRPVGTLNALGLSGAVSPAVLAAAAAAVAG